MRPTYNTNKTIADHLAALDQKDTWSLIMFCLYKLQDDPEWLVMSELSYILKSQELVKFLNYFGGLTIKIPKTSDLRLLMEAFTLYRLVNFDGLDINVAVRELDTDEFTVDDIKRTYIKILDVVKDYDFTV